MNLFHFRLIRNLAGKIPPALQIDCVGQTACVKFGGVKSLYRADVGT